MRIALVTCRVLPEPDPDEKLLVEALEARGARPKLAAWDDPDVVWDAFDLAVLRSSWNYHHHLDAFLGWAESVAEKTRLMNGLDVVRWNAHKSYLRDLERRGVAVVPTAWADRGSAVDLSEVLAARGWKDVVLKPAVSAASFSTHRVRGGEIAAGQAALDQILKTRDAMIQPYVASVEAYGERSIIVIDGALTHAVRKTPRFGGEAESVSKGALPIGDEERAAAQLILRTVGRDLLYARVDLARDEGGRPMLMELELIEPSLFLLQSPAALDRFASAICARAAR